MSFVVKGKLGKQDVIIEWDNGQINTDNLTQRFINIHNNSKIPTPGPPPMSFTGDRLKESLSAFWFITDTITVITSVEGDIPYPDSPPKGAIN